MPVDGKGFAPRLGLVWASERLTSRGDFGDVRLGTSKLSANQHQGLERAGAGMVEEVKDDVIRDGRVTESCRMPCSE